MNYSIAFKNLPFEPERRQVIYVENRYDERINSIIRGRYNWLKWTFKRANLDFVYLPMFFNDEEIKEKVLYYAPYLTEEIMDKVEEEVLMTGEPGPDEEPQVEYSRTPNFWDKIKRGEFKFGKSIVMEEDGSECSREVTPSKLEDLHLRDFT